MSIARALVNKPQIIIADEPTAALDKENAEVVFELLKKINEELRITIIMVSHDNMAENYVDRVIKLSNGQIVS